MWAIALQIIQSTWSSVVENWIIATVFGALGLSGGVYVWLAKLGLNELWSRLINPFLKKEAAGADEAIKEDKNLDALHKAEASGDKDAIKKSALDVLNG